MRWSELNLLTDEPIWLLPSTRTKNGREHAVPLAGPAVTLLKNINRVQTRFEENGIEKMTESPFVFTTTGETSISGFSRAKARLDAAMLAVAQAKAKKHGVDLGEIKIAPWHLHDLRRTAASGMARLGVSVSVVEKVLNHISGTFAGIVGVYQRHDFLAEKRHALNLWAEHVISLTTTKKSNVVKMNKGSR